MKVLYKGQFAPSLFVDLASRFEFIDLIDPLHIEPNARAASVLLTRGRLQVTSALLKELPDLKLIIKAGSGLDTIDLGAAQSRGISVIATRGSEHAVAELAIGFMFACSRHIRQLDAATRDGDWTAKERFIGGELAGRRLGLVGFGAIARSLAVMAKALDMEVGFWDRTPDKPEKIATCFATGARRFDGLEDMARWSGILSLHLPLEPETRGLVNLQVLQALPRGSVLINTARAELVECEALEQNLSDGHIGAAGLDVHYAEYSDAPNPFRRYPSVICTPHIGAQTAETHLRIALRIQDLLEHFATNRLQKGGQSCA